MSELRLAGQIEPISGAVAQLGERELCKLEVVGSIPIGSTSLRSRSERRLPRRSPQGEGGLLHWRATARPATFAREAKGASQTTANVRDGISVFRTCAYTQMRAHVRYL